MMDDLISRQDLLESIERISVKGNVLDDDWVYRFIQEFPSAQQEIIRCKDCKYSYSMITARSKDGQERWERFCDKHKNWYPKDDWFCADGEGKEE